MNIEELQTQVHDLFSLHWDEFMKLHEAWNRYGNRVLTETEKIEVSMLFDSIQDKFKELYPVMNFVIQRYQSCRNLLTSHNDWLEHLEKNGIIKRDKQNVA